MAQISAQQTPATRFRPVPARTQLFALAWVRWRMFANSFARRLTGPRQAVQVVAGILLRALVYGLVATFAIGPIALCGFFAWTFVHEGHPRTLVLLLFGISLVWQLFAANGVSIAATISRFDPSSLLRFPIPFGRYVLLRTLLGLLTPSTILGCLMLLGAAIGMSIADPALLWPALLVLSLYAWTNIFFARMVPAWLERWMANRRFSEIFGAFFVLLMAGVQLLGLYVSRLASARERGSLASLASSLSSFINNLRWLPPGVAIHAIVVRGELARPFTDLLMLCAWTALFFALFAVRLHKQFLGEQPTGGVSRGRDAVSTRAHFRSPSPIVTASFPTPVLSTVLLACLRKEWLEFRSVSRFISMLTPLFFVIVLADGVFGKHPNFFLPAATAYAMLGFLAKLYNLFGADGLGMQMYLLAPVRLRDVIIAKNIAGVMPVVAEAILAWIVILLIARAGISPSMQAAAFFWLLFVIAFNLALGTVRSIQEPRKDLARQARQKQTPVGRTNTWLVIAVSFGSLVLYAPVTLICSYAGHPELAVVMFAALAIAAIAAYTVVLRNSDKLILNYRDRLAEELCRL